ncbi:MAG: leucyl aminopeptidase family protein [Myxococcota bacterium]|nr:leucyl aminopeptidase family protein [Myxococcota bacterium]
MSMQSTLTITDKLPQTDCVLILGRKSDFINNKPLIERFSIPKTTWNAILKSLRPKANGVSTITWVDNQKIIFAMLPEICSRHNSPSRAWAIPSLVAPLRGVKKAGILVLVDPKDQEATIMGIARGLPSFHQKSGIPQREVFVELAMDQVFDYNLQILANATRYAASLFDRPTNSLNVSQFVQEATDIASRTNVAIQVLRGESLKSQGFGGLIAVGQAAIDGPALVVLHWKPENPTQSIAWVGKGIVYDTGGLSIKSKTGMPSMKGDMGGAAAVLAAFEAAVHLRVPYELRAILCLAENAVGPHSVRPDDIIKMKSGKTVEINNTDAEGRLVLADGVNWAATSTNSDIIIDIATLTGAAPIAVGKNFAALYSNDEDLEQRAVIAGRIIGEPCHPLPYTPELYFQEFSSNIADMKNSVKNRANAQSACAGQFIGNHLPSTPPRWLHIDIAGPAWNTSKGGSGFGVGLLLKLCESLST